VTWEAMLRVNLLGPAWLCRAAIPRMAEAGGGAIVNVSSRAAARGTPRHSAYTASKGALEALTRAIAADHAGQGIRANAVRPGYVLHEQRDAALDPDRRRHLEATQLTRLLTADDVAHAVVFLASRESESITGLVLPVDGGSSTARARTLG
jgi:2-keto-3-deoxy-L-fuconate dehydrogenase